MSKKANKKEDTLSQLKKEEDKLKKNKKKEEEEEEQSEENEEENNQNVVKQQTVQKADRPKNLKDLLGGGDNKAKPKPKKKEKEKEKKNKYDEPKKLTFTNSKKTGNANKTGDAKENAKIEKTTRDYLEKDKQKVYNEDVAKPQFTTNVDEDKKFVELNKNEDVRKIFFKIFIVFIIIAISEKYG